MFGSIFYNLWGALIAFSTYFFITLQSVYSPIRIVIGSFVTAIVAFFVMFFVRYLVSFILYTPESEESVTDDRVDETKQVENDSERNLEKQVTNSTVEFQDENTEEIAQVVRTMMNREEEQVNL